MKLITEEWLRRARDDQGGCPRMRYFFSRSRKAKIITTPLK
jgi:hypothetical protein